MAAHLHPIEALNGLDVHQFADALRPLFEAAEPLASALYAERPFGSYTELLDRAESAAKRLTPAEQRELLSGHPRIGERPETVRQLSALAYSEQGYDREASATAAELQAVYRELARLNREYEQRFGFRFVIFVNGRPKSDIVTALQERLHNSREAELQAGLSAVLAIGRDRLRTLAG